MTQASVRLVRISRTQLQVSDGSYQTTTSRPLSAPGSRIWLKQPEPNKSILPLPLSVYPAYSVVPHHRSFTPITRSRISNPSSPSNTPCPSSTGHPATSPCPSSKRHPKLRFHPQNHPIPPDIPSKNPLRCEFFRDFSNSHKPMKTSDLNQDSTMKSTTILTLHGIFF